jgi:hypothetical protein
MSEMEMYLKALKNSPMLTKRCFYIKCKLRKKNEVGWSCGMHGEEQGCIQGFGGET